MATRKRHPSSGDGRRTNTGSWKFCRGRGADRTPGTARRGSRLGDDAWPNKTRRIRAAFQNSAASGRFLIAKKPHWSAEEHRRLINFIEAVKQTGKRARPGAVPALAKSLGRSRAAVALQLSRTRRGALAAYRARALGCGTAEAIRLGRKELDPPSSLFYGNLVTNYVEVPMSTKPVKVDPTVLALARDVLIRKVAARLAPKRKTA